MMALALAEDSLSKRERCDEIIDELGKLSEKMRAFMQVGLTSPWAPMLIFLFPSVDSSLPCPVTATFHAAGTIALQATCARCASVSPYDAHHLFCCIGCLVLQKQDKAMLELAAELKDANSLMFFARGNNYATALEAALKVRIRALQANPLPLPASPTATVSDCVAESPVLLLHVCFCDSC